MTRINCEADGKGLEKRYMFENMHQKRLALSLQVHGKLAAGLPELK
jgi:hypothetical protein